MKNICNFISFENEKIFFLHKKELIHTILTWLLFFNFFLKEYDFPYSYQIDNVELNFIYINSTWFR